MPMVKRSKTLIGPVERAKDFSTLFALVTDMGTPSTK
jgi:hypothetical protein